MNNKTKATAAASILAVALMAEPVIAHADKDGFEKCKGIVKAGMNDCGANGHACAGLAAADNDPNEWVFLPEGTCDKIAGASVVGAKAQSDKMKSES